MGDIDKVSSVLAALERLGVEVDVDEFGHGCSNLEQLSQLKINALKVNTRNVSPALTETIVALGHNLGLGVIAERIETDTTLAPLRKRKNLKLQGFHLCAPMSAEQFPDWYRRRLEA